MGVYSDGEIHLRVRRRMCYLQLSGCYGNMTLPGSAETLSAVSKDCLDRYTGRVKNACKKA